jgi:hypothetical protein
VISRSNHRDKCGVRGEVRLSIRPHHDDGKKLSVYLPIVLVEEEHWPAGSGEDAWKCGTAGASPFRGCKLESLNGCDSSIGVVVCHRASCQGSTPAEIPWCPFPASPQVPCSARRGVNTLALRTPIQEPPDRGPRTPSGYRCPFISTRRESTRVGCFVYCCLLVHLVLKRGANAKVLRLHFVTQPISKCCLVAWKKCARTPHPYSGHYRLQASSWLGGWHRWLECGRVVCAGVFLAMRW